MTDDILNPSVNGEESTPLPLSDLVVTSPLPDNTVPFAASRNRAAQTAMLSPDPSTAVDNYNSIMNEGAQGSSTTQKALASGIDSNTDVKNLGDLQRYLSNPNIDIATKQAVTKGFTDNLWLKDKGATIQTNQLAAPAEGETPDAEVARISTADAFREMGQARTEAQGLWNKHIAASEDRSLGGALADFGGGVAPFSDAVITQKITAALEEETRNTSFPFTQKATAAQPGFNKQDIRSWLYNLPPEQQVAATKAVIKVLSNNSSLMFGNDNQYKQFEIGDQIFNQGGYSNTQAFIDNVAPLLDVLGLGSSFRKGAAKVLEPAATRSEPGSFQLSQVGADARAEPRFEGTKTPVQTPQTTPSVLGGSGVKPAAPGANNGPLLTPKGPSTAVPENAGTVGVEGTKPTVSTNGATPSLLGGSGRNLQQVETNNKVPALLRRQPKNEAANTLADQQARVETNSVVRQEAPASTGNIVEQSNPGTAKQLFNAATTADTTEASEAIYGVEPIQAAVNSVMPQVTTDVGAITTKVADIAKQERLANAPDANVVDALFDSGATWFTPKEKAAFRAQVVSDFESASGLRMNEAMSSFKFDGLRAQVSAVYEPGEGSWSSAEDAVNQAVFAARKYGVTKDDVTLLAKQGLDHVPVSLEDAAGLEGNFKVRIDTPYELNPQDINGLEALDVKRNWTDKFSQTMSNTKGSVSRYMFDAASQVHSTISNSALVATDQAARLEKVLLGQAQEYTDVYSKLPKARQAKMDDYLREANFNGIDFDQADLISRGFNPTEIGAIAKWRKYWDTQYYLENFDQVRTLRNRGFQKFENPNFEVYAKPISKNGNLGRLYDPATDTVRQLAAGELDQLYQSGGTLARFRRPAQVNGEEIEHMIVRNTPTEYLRGVKDVDQVLNYRKGYYRLSYKNPVFVDSIERDAAGKIISSSRRTVAVAGDTPEAEAFAKRMTANTGKEHIARPDRNALASDSDEAWDLNQASGRLAQRQRGKLLQDAGGLNRLGDGSFIENPAEAAVKAAKSISGRSISRPMLETAKERWLQQYGQRYAQAERGVTNFPSKLEDIRDIEKGLNTSKEIADARTTFAYIKFLEDGYVNSMDDFLKGLFHDVAHQLGSRGYGTAERIANSAAGFNPLSKAKQITSMAYIGSNVLRQWIIQPYQAMRMIGYNPQGILNGNVPRYVTAYLADSFGAANKAIKGGQDFVDFIKKSGLVDAVDKSNLVRGTLMQAADQGTRAGKIAKFVPNTLRKIGFDIGETGNLLGHAASVYDRYVRLGRDMTNKEVVDAARAEIRQLSYGMNAAGDMPYNQTTASLVFQFMQSPHKALLQLTNRALDPWVRARMAITDAVMWGGPTYLISQMVGGANVLPDNPTARSILENGLTTTAYNQLLQSMFDDYSPIDFKALDPRPDLNGIQKGVVAWMTGGGGAILANSATGGLFGENGRVATAFKTAGRHFGFIPEYDDNKPTTTLAMLNDIASISSGWSNGYRAYIMLQTQKRLDSYGHTIDRTTSTPEILAQMFGFGSASQSAIFEMSQQASADEKKMKDDVSQAVKDIKKYYAKEYTDGDNDIRFVTGVSGALLLRYQDRPEMLYEANKQLMQGFKGSDDIALLNRIIANSGFVDSSNAKDQLKRLLDSGAIKQQDYTQASSLLDDMDNARKNLSTQLNKGKK